MVKFKKSWLHLNEPLPKTKTGTPSFWCCFMGQAISSRKNGSGKAWTETFAVGWHQFVEAVQKR